MSRLRFGLAALAGQRGRAAGARALTLRAASYAWRAIADILAREGHSTETEADYLTGRAERDARLAASPRSAK